MRRMVEKVDIAVQFFCFFAVDGLEGTEMLKQARENCRGAEVWTRLGTKIASRSAVLPTAYHVGRPVQPTLLCIQPKLG